MTTEPPWGVELVLDEIVDVMVPHVQEKPGHIEVRVNVSIDWANHGSSAEEIRQWPIEFPSAEFLPETVAEFARPLVVRPTSPGIFMQERNVSVVMWFERGPSLPDEITRELLAQAGMGFRRQPRHRIEADADRPGQFGVVPRLEALALDVERRVRAELAEAELDHANRLLEMQGAHEEAMVRAAGIIAGVVLERHLADVIDSANETLEPPQQYTPDAKRDGIVRYVTWLVGQGVIELSERTALEELALVRDCCSRPPGGTLRMPARDEVAKLIQDVRRYTGEIRMP